jgi:hypothetical protein
MFSPNKSQEEYFGMLPLSPQQLKAICEEFAGSGEYDRVKDPDCVGKFDKVVTQIGRLPPLKKGGDVCM